MNPFTWEIFDRRKSQSRTCFNHLYLLNIALVVCILYKANSFIILDFILNNHPN